MGRWRFQSLFSWNSLSDDMRLVENKMDFASFNPCFRGTRSRTTGRTWCLRTGYVSILVFVELALGHWQREGRLSVAHKQFQSLFSWNSLSDGKLLCRWHRRSRVSILVFVELALGLEKRLRPMRPEVRFNPCFRGTRSRTAESLCLCEQASVSILVFVELALGRVTAALQCIL